MNLAKKKALAAKALNVGKNRLIFMENGLSEIKEAITKQDIKDLYSSGVIKIKEIKGRKKIVKRKTKRGEGKIKKRLKNTKQNYAKTTRKLRAYVGELKRMGKIDVDRYKELRKKIKAKEFKSKNQLRETLKEK
jgi:ribosomal protein L19E